MGVPGWLLRYAYRPLVKRDDWQASTSLGRRVHTSVIVSLCRNFVNLSSVRQQAFRWGIRL